MAPAPFTMISVTSGSRMKGSMGPRPRMLSPICWMTRAFSCTESGIRSSSRSSRRRPWTSSWRSLSDRVASYNFGPKDSTSWPWTLLRTSAVRSGRSIFDSRSANDISLYLLHRRFRAGAAKAREAGGVRRRTEPDDSAGERSSQRLDGVAVRSFLQCQEVADRSLRFGAEIREDVSKTQVQVEESHTLVRTRRERGSEVTRQKRLAGAALGGEQRDDPAPSLPAARTVPVPRAEAPGPFEGPLQSVAEIVAPA